MAIPELIIADVDGVFTNDRAEPNQRLITMSAEIGTRIPFGFVTGRGRPWLKRNFLPALTAVYSKNEPLKGMVCAEYGGFVMNWHHQDGDWHSWRNPKFEPLHVLRVPIRTRIAHIGTRIFFDDEKEIMISVEACHRFRDTNSDLVDVCLGVAEAVLHDYAIDELDLEFQRTTYACDLVPKGMNKAYGAGYILNDKIAPPPHTHLIGDSLSDLLLAHPFQERGLNYTLHFVGDPDLITSEHRAQYRIEVTSKRYDEGTREVLQQFL